MKSKNKTLRGRKDKGLVETNTKRTSSSIATRGNGVPAEAHTFVFKEPLTDQDRWLIGNYENKEAIIFNTSKKEFIIRLVISWFMFLLIGILIGSTI